MTQTNACGLKLGFEKNLWKYEEVSVKCLKVSMVFCLCSNIRKRKILINIKIIYEGIKLL